MVQCLNGLPLESSNNCTLGPGAVAVTVPCPPKVSNASGAPLGTVLDHVGICDLASLIGFRNPDPYFVIETNT
jgi:hypothetical protein